MIEQEPRISVVFREESELVHNYRYFYFLANELTHIALNDKHDINAFRYSMGAVIFSYTTIETFVNHVLRSPREQLHDELFSALSDGLNEKIERFSLSEKIEFAVRFYPNSKIKQLNKGEEPFQSFELLRQLRNFLVHYVPKMEVVYSDDAAYLEQITRLEKSAHTKFEFEANIGNARRSFVYRCFNKNCALWAFNSVQPFIDWLCDSLDISRPELTRYWDLSPRSDDAGEGKQ